MKEVQYQTCGTCSTQINFIITDDNKIHNLQFTRGCNGNLKAIAKLCEGKDAVEVRDLLAGNTCGPKPTSCADQLARAITKALEEK